MARLTAGISEAYYAVKSWKGVNENPDGDTNLRDGEAATMRNFRITDGGALRKRPGSAVVAGLLNNYSLTVGEEQVVLEEVGKSLFESTAHVGATVNDNGEIVFTGESKTINEDTQEGCVELYYPSSDPAKAWQHTRLVTELAEGMLRGKGGAINVQNEHYKGLVPYLFYTFDYSYKIEDVPILSSVTVYHGFSIVNGELELTDPVTYSAAHKAEHPYSELYNRTGTYSRPDLWKSVALYRHTDGVVYQLAHGGDIHWETGGVAGYYFAGCPFIEYIPDKHTWYAKPVNNTPNTADTVVRGIWSGFVDSKEYIVAACNGHLWSLSETNGVWAKTDIGVIDTSDHVCLFGFGSKLYCLDGKQYYVWDGTNFTEVDGYVPLLATASAPSGGGTSLERINMLTPKRRQRFSADGEAKEYQLIETDIQMVDSVTVNGASVQFTADTATGKVTFNSAPAKGTNNVEITWTAKTSGRDGVVKMRYAEFYNGANDSRVFLYGNGSNITFYSDITEAGAASAEYFPALNEIAIGDSNTPITSLIRQYSRLMAFKSGGSAWSIYYDAITLADGSTTAGFYCNPVNKSIGNDALGQAVLVENKPRTLDGRSIYEWQSASGGYITNDQRNAKRISQKVENTLLGFDLSKCVMFFDKIKHEFYCVHEGTAVVQNTENDAWYIYTDFPAEALIVHKDDLYYGTPNGDLRKFSDAYTIDSGRAIDAYWESGSLSFGRDYILKYSPTVWVGLKQEDKAAISVGIETDVEAPMYEYITLPADSDAMPRMNRAKLKAKKFTYYKLLFKSNSADTRATVVAADVRVKYNINVK